jgi:hypothetical protein
MNGGIARRLLYHALTMHEWKLDRQAKASLLRVINSVVTEKESVSGKSHQSGKR